MKVHEKIRFMRESKEWSQEEMAVKLNMSVSGYSKIERGETKPHIPKLIQIAEVLETDVVELVDSGKNYIHISRNNNNIIDSSTELAFENKNLHTIISHRDETIEYLKQEIGYLKEMLVLCKTPRS